MALETISAVQPPAANGVHVDPPPAEPAPAVEPEARPAEGVKIDPEQLRVLARTSRELRETRAKLAELEARSAKPADLPPEVAARAAHVAEIEKLAKESPLKALERLGLTYEAITQAMLASDPGAEVSPEVKEALETTKALKARAEAEDKAKVEREAKEKTEADARRAIEAKEIHAQTVAWVKSAAEKVAEEGGESKWPRVVAKAEFDALTTQLEQAVVSFLVEENAKLAKDGKPPRDLTQPEADSMLSQILDRAERWYRFEESETADAGQTPQSSVRKYGTGGVVSRQTEPRGPAQEERKPRPTIGAERGPTLSLTPARRQLTAAEAKAKVLAALRNAPE